MKTGELPVFTGNPGASKGGLERARRQSPAQRSQLAERGGKATVRRYGIGFFSALGKKEKKNATPQG